MSREIKFRFWDSRKMDYSGKDATIWNGLLVCEGDTIPMQFTGLKDSNGKDIYEGDIVLCGDDGEYFGQKYDESLDDYIDIDKFIVEFCSHDGYVAFDLKNNPCDEMNGLSHAYYAGYIQILGNIYENPELLEEVKK